jgi:hypothetical protein
MINRGEYVKIKNVFLNNYMTYNEKKSLYESIMKEVAKTVKKRINESFYVPLSISDNGEIRFE